ncbi:excitatory amino acid transporter 4-like [Amphiura filiformis]|uniref:excitatory amino acid transporter 4-like n=1 Tax=Amphiura filiformis TaxID=82378 RepID=UPI003B20DCA4
MADMDETNRLIGLHQKRAKEHEQDSQNRTTRCGQGCLSWVRTNLLMVFTIIGIVVGIALGFGLHPYNLSDEAILIIGFPGDIFMRCLQLLILPIIVTSLITGTADLDVKSNYRLAIRAIAYYLTTTTIAATIGLLCVLTIQPGKAATKPESAGHDPPELEGSALDAILDIFRNLFPENIVQACFQQIETFYEDQNITRTVKVITTTTEFNLTYMFPTSVEDNTSEWETITVGTKQVRQLRYVDRMNVLAGETTEVAGVTSRATGRGFAGCLCYRESLPDGVVFNFQV